MTRFEENKMALDEIARIAELLSHNPLGKPHEEMMEFHLGAIHIILTDISKSLAIIADKTESEEV